MLLLTVVFVFVNTPGLTPLSPLWVFSRLWGEWVSNLTIEGARKALDFFGKAINCFRRGAGWSERPLGVKKGYGVKGSETL